MNHNEESLTMPPMDERERILRERYRQQFDQYRRCAEHLREELTKTLQDNKISVHLVEARAKDEKSFITKALKPEKDYSNPFLDITDLVGLRVIAYYETDLDNIGDALLARFGKPQEQQNKKPENEAHFGYRSQHYIIPFTSDLADAAQVSGVEGLSFEIQVRTVLQHAWAAVSHKLDYKGEGTAHEQLKRKLCRLSALFEIADDEFVSLRNAYQSLSADIADKLKESAQGIPLDELSLSQFLEASPLVRSLDERARAAHFIFNDPFRTERDERDALAKLIQLCARAGLRTIDELAEVLKKNDLDPRDYLGRQYRENQKKGRAYWYATSAFICQLLIIKEHTHSLDEDDLIDLGWDQAMAMQVLGVAKNC